jgi:7-cyano-7-deazaguanine tRNA-ribosyltransferase
MFELKERDGLARICRLSTKHGDVETPALMPVINPNKQLVKTEELKALGAEIVITNAYIIKRSYGDLACEKGLHNLLGFDGPIMTDSGTFQSHVYGSVETTNKEIVEYEVRIGSDIGTILDEFVEPDDSYEIAERKVAETIKRAKEAREISGEMLLATPVQGGLHLDLRRKCAVELSDIGDFFPLGGIVPLMENYRFASLVDVAMTARCALPASAPVHFFGAGHPMIFGLACMMGADFFDSASYAKYAADGRYLTSTGTVSFEELDELPCACPVCSSTDARELRELDESARYRQLALHNLHVCFAEIRSVKKAIRNNELWDYVEQRMSAHPQMQNAFPALLRYRDFFERHEPLARKVFFYRNFYSMHRPDVSRFRKRVFERYLAKSRRNVLVIFPNSQAPYFDRWIENAQRVLAITDADFIVDTYFGPLPLELSLLYPPGVSVLPQHPGRDAEALRNAYMLKLAHTHNYRLALYWEGERTLDVLANLCRSTDAHENFELRMLAAICDFQFGVGAGSVLISGNIEIVRSKNTGRIRNVHRNGKHILSMRNDGYFNLKIEGAKLLMEKFGKPALRCIVSREAYEFNVRGKNVFAKFVLEMDRNLVPDDEVIVVNEDDEIAGVGRVVLTADECRTFRTGIAVKVREGVHEGN